MKKNIMFPFILLVVLLIIQIVLMFQTHAKFPKDEKVAKTWSSKEQLECANILLAKGLNSEAAQAFEAYIAESDVDRKELAKICFRLGKIYMELFEYRKALKSFYKAEMLNSNGVFMEEMNQKVVEALENLGMTQQAQYELHARTSMIKPDREEGRIIARIGKEEISETEINKVIDRMPEWMRKNLEEPQRKLEFIREYVAIEVLYGKAKRLGIHKTHKIIESIEDLKKQLVVNELLQNEIEKNLKITPQDVELYYKANLDKYKDDKEPQNQKSFEEVKSQVEYEYRAKKQIELTSSLLEKALKEQEVEIFYDIPESKDTKVEDAEIKK